MSGLQSSKRSGYLRNNWPLYMLLLPGLALLIVFRYFPIYGLIIAFQDYNPVKGYFGSPWVGLKHFYAFFRDPYCFRIIRNTFVLGIYSIIFVFPAPIILALMINEVRISSAKRVIQTISYMPHFLSVVIVVGLMRDLFDTSGIVNECLRALGLTTKKILFFTDPTKFRPMYILSTIWQSVGFSSIIYLGAMSNINEDLYEAAAIDGAGRMRRVIHVTIPGILPTVIILFIMQMGSILGNDYQKILLIYSSRTYSTADVISTYVYRQGIAGSSFSYSTAVNLISTVISLIFLLVTNVTIAKISDDGTSLF